MNRPRQFAVCPFAFAAWMILLVASTAPCQDQQPDNTDQFSSPLQIAIARGMKPGGNLIEELDKLEDAPIRTRRDARAICDALKNLPLERPKAQQITSPLYELAVLFQKAEDRESPAFGVLRDEGIPQLIRIFDAKIKDPAGDAGDLLILLKVFAMYESKEGAERIVAAARKPLDPDSFIWHVILEPFSKDHPHSEYIFEALRDPLPQGFIAVALLDSANVAANEALLKRHPFDSEAGWKKLEGWLKDREQEDFSYAQSAAAALPFLSNPARDRLLALALQHPSVNVQLEAAWADGKLGNEGGLKTLTKFCLDVNHSHVAQGYLAELEREDLIPEAAKVPEFQAKAEFVQWLAHPNELGQPPDEMETVDHRELDWPPERESRPFWLIKYRLRDPNGLEGDDVDCGLVGSTTWCFFGYRMDQRPPEDVYAIHCYWEMEQQGLIKEPELTDESEFSGMFSQWQGARLQDPRIICAADLSSRLKPAQRRVALASAKLDGQEGWVVLDGTRSAWYPLAEQPEATHETVVLKIHVGRQLLGFQDPPNRKKYLVPDPHKREPKQIIAAYEKLMAEARDAKPKRQQILLAVLGPLVKHFGDYVQALVTVNKADRQDTLIDVYGRFLKLAEQVDKSNRTVVYDPFGVLGHAFDDEADALIVRGRSDEVVKQIELFAPHWGHNLGYSQLGKAAFKAGKFDMAEKYLTKLQDGMEYDHRFVEMGLLAEIWHKRGEAQKARNLLTDCLKKLAADYQQSNFEPDRKLIAAIIEHHIATYLRLFPKSEPELETLGIPIKPGK